MNVVDRQTYFLEPGFIYLSSAPVVIQTVLGNSVSICLWDKMKRIGAMNHFLYPSTNDKEKSTSNYGNVATLTILKMMVEAGCNKQDLVAHLLGGACPPEDRDQDLGKRNAASARGILAHHKVDIVSEDVGGKIGRKIVFDTATGHVAVLKVHNLRKSDWHQ